MTTWADQVDPLGSGDGENDAHRRRYLRINHVGDGVAASRDRF